MPKKKTALIPTERITQAIIVLRRQKVMLDSDLAALYGVTTKRLNEQVRRNLDRFPDDFMFKLTPREAARLRSQFATLKTGRGQHRKYRPQVFTEHGALQLASVLRSPQATEMSILVVRAFVRLREVLAAHRNLAAQLRKLEKRLDMNDEAVSGLYAAIRRLMAAPTPSKNPIGYVPLEEQK